MTEWKSMKLAPRSGKLILVHLKDTTRVVHVYWYDNCWTAQNSHDIWEERETNGWIDSPDLPEKKSELRELYHKYNHDLTDASCCPGYWDLMDKIIEKLEGPTCIRGDDDCQLKGNDGKYCKKCDGRWS